MLSRLQSLNLSGGMVPFINRSISSSALTEWWNDLVTKLARYRLQYGPPPTPALFQHPWKVIPSWNGAAWTATIRPGFVNGIPPQAMDSVTGILHPLISDPVLLLGVSRGLDGTGINPDKSVESIPAFFQALGVHKPPSDISVDSVSGAVTSIASSTASLPSRTLRACDISLSQARTGLVPTVTVVDGSGVAGEVVQYGVSFSGTVLAEQGITPRIHVSSRWYPPASPSARELLLGGATDPQTDELLIATVYWLSPSAADASPQLDGSWTPYVEQGLFWNLNHAPQTRIPPAPPSPITIHTGLLGGWADIIFNQILAPLNDAATLVQALNSTVSQQGRFWTT